MSQWADHKRRFYRDICTYGASDLNNLQSMLGNAWGVDALRLTRWWRRFQELPEVTPGMERFVNHYTQGADPEFMLMRSGSDGEEIRHAESFNLKAGRAFGADNNGRLVEVRPFPSRNQLEVLASVHDTLRWMYLLTQPAQPLAWVCGAYLYGDGLGGHVHVGRKRGKLRAQEVAALDSSMKLMERMAMFPASQIQRRRDGDQFRQHYGLYGDVRPQPYGFEYRTFASWLDSPWMAYFHLVLAKLAVFDPEIFNAECGNPVQHVENILRYYRGLDDDARLALWALKTKGIPLHLGGDFKPRWGLGGYKNITRWEQQVFVPNAVPPSGDTVEELWSFLAKGEPIKSGVIPTIGWKPMTVPKGLVPLLDWTNTHGVHQKGVGELIWDLVGLGDVPILFRGNEDYRRLMVPTGLLKYMPADWKSKFKGRADTYLEERTFMVGDVHIDAPEDTREMLTSGAFPIWKIGEADETTAEKWMEGLKVRPLKAERKLMGRERVYE